MSQSGLPPMFSFYWNFVEGSRHDGKFRPQKCTSSAEHTRKWVVLLALHLQIIKGISSEAYLFRVGGMSNSETPTSKSSDLEFFGRSICLSIDVEVR